MRLQKRDMRDDKLVMHVVLALTEKHPCKETHLKQAQTLHTLWRRENAATSIHSASAKIGWQTDCRIVCD